jgi:predicted transcriptional regulator
MALHDYSQLVVTTGPRDIKGIISYKSVAQAYLQGEPKTVGDCLDENVPQVELDEPLLRVVERFNEYSAVLIIRTDKTLAGIVTPADISGEFGAMAAPFASYRTD